MNTKYIIQSNPLIFLNELIEHLNNGYCIQDTNEGSVCDTPANKTITLYEEPEREFDPYYGGLITVSDYNSHAFLLEVQAAVKGGVTLDTETVYWDIGGIKSVQGSKGVYSKVQLQELDWETLKEVCKAVGVSGRDRTLIITRYLQHYEEQE